MVINERHKEILLMSMQGLKTKEIAQKLNISVNTVKYHKKNIYASLNTKTIAESVIKAIELRLVDIESKKDYSEG